MHLPPDTAHPSPWGPDTPHLLPLAASQHKNKHPHAPVILATPFPTGGPGCSGELPLLVEQGPYELEGFNVSTGAGGDVLVRRRRYSWDRQFHLLYLDQPVGTGFSYSTVGRVGESARVRAACVCVFVVRAVSVDSVCGVDRHPTCQRSLAATCHVQHAQDPHDKAHNERDVSRDVLDFLRQFYAGECVGA